jgi:DMSO/TMAO reductase YedYZ heme-binding membrane subunit
MARNRTNNSVALHNRWWEWLLSLAIHAAGCLTMMWYMTLRQRSFSLFSFNKSLALSAVGILGLVIFLGTLQRSGLARGLTALRRPLSILSVIAALIHAVISLNYLPQYYNWNYFAEHWLPLLFGLGALLGFVILWITSYPHFHRIMGHETWKKYQRWLYRLLLLVALHILFLGKAVCNIRWLENVYKAQANTTVPPPSLPVLILLSIVLTIRILEPLFRGPASKHEE